MGFVKKIIAVTTKNTIVQESYVMILKSQELVKDYKSIRQKFCAKWI